MQEIILTLGLQASGKSTYSKKLVAEQGYVRVNKDDIREMLYNSLWTKNKENLVLSVRDHIVEEALKEGKSVVVDDTNFNIKHFKQMCLIAQQFDKDITVREKYFPVELDEAIRRNEERIKNGYRTTVTADVIRNTYDRYVKGKKIEEREEIFKSASSQDNETILSRNSVCGTSIEISNHNVNKLHKVPCIIADLDGTTALVGDRSFYDSSNCHEVDLPNWPVIKTILMFYKTGYEIIFVSGREEKYRESTDLFLNKYVTERVAAVDKELGITPYNQPIPRKLFMRKTGDMRKDSIVKKEIYREEIEPKYEVLLCLDDRSSVVRGWRDMGLTCFQVAPGMF